MWRWIFVCFCFVLNAEITALYLTWLKDPTTTMQIQWHSFGKIDGTLHLLEDDKWLPFESSHINYDDFLIHTVQLENLKPDTLYSFQIENEVYKFKTAPQDLIEPIRFIVGGDVYQSQKLFRKMAETIVKKDPLFAALGGDIAYAITTFCNQGNLKRWLHFLKDWKNYMITQENRVIPFLIAPGNHDIAPDCYKVFFDLFNFEANQIYRALDFGSYLSLVFLDTGHFQPIEKRQTLWLDKALQDRQEFLYCFPIYHIGAYPSFYSSERSSSVKIRRNWVPLFEKYHLPIAFEHDCHNYKRTFPILKGKIDQEGVTYIGGGSWGVPPRRAKNNWYIDQKAKINSVIIVDLSKQTAELEAIDLFGNVIDEISINAKQI